MESYEVCSQQVPQRSLRAARLQTALTQAWSALLVSYKTLALIIFAQRLICLIGRANLPAAHYSLTNKAYHHARPV